MKNLQGTMQSPSLRLSDSKLGRWIGGIVFIVFFSLLSFGSGGEWYALCPAMTMLFPFVILCCIGIFRGYKLPSPGILGWLAMTAGGYFLIRASTSPWIFNAIDDVNLIIFGIVFFILGTCIGGNRKEENKLPALIATLGGLHAILWIWQNISGDVSSWFRPDYSPLGIELKNFGLFGYKNFCGHFFSICGFFLCAWSLGSSRKWGKYFWLGSLLIGLSFTCHSRAAFPNCLLGTLICGFIYLTNIYHQTKKFIACSIIFTILLILGTSFVLLDLSNGKGSLDTLLNTYIFGVRIDLTKEAWSLADNAPFFGHGARMYTNLALENIAGSHNPNFAHHEYAQAACDYGYIGFTIMLLLLGSGLFIGIRQILRQIHHSEENAPLVYGAFCVIAIASIHAYGEFIWHNPALLSCSALSLGILYAYGPRKLKALPITGKFTYSLIAIGIGLYGLIYAIWVYPMFISSWNAAPCTTTSNKALKQAFFDYHHPTLSTQYIYQSVNAKTSESELKGIDSALSQTEAKSPNNHALVASRALIYLYQGKYEQAEKVLRPYCQNPCKYTDNMYPWKTTYANILYTWGIALAKTEPNKSLSLFQEALDTLTPLTNKWLYFRAGDPKVRKKHRQDINSLKLSIRILKHQGATPDHSWKKN